jgi:hypothetical protein
MAYAGVPYVLPDPQVRRWPCYYNVERLLPSWLGVDNQPVESKGPFAAARPDVAEHDSRRASSRFQK